MYVDNHNMEPESYSQTCTKAIFDVALFKDTQSWSCSQINKSNLTLSTSQDLL